MQIHGPSFLHGSQAISGPHRVAGAKPTAETTYAAPTDQLDISPEANFISQVRDLPDIRADRVAELRAQIAAGTYETEQKLSATLDRLLDEFA